VRLRVLNGDGVGFRLAFGRGGLGGKENTQEADREGHEQKRRFDGVPHRGSKPYQSSQAGSVLVLW